MNEYFVAYITFGIRRFRQSASSSPSFLDWKIKIRKMLSKTSITWIEKVYAMLDALFERAEGNVFYLCVHNHPLPLVLRKIYQAHCNLQCKDIRESTLPCLDQKLSNRCGCCCSQPTLHRVVLSKGLRHTPLECPDVCGRLLYRIRLLQLSYLVKVNQLDLEIWHRTSLPPHLARDAEHTFSSITSL